MSNTRAQARGQKQTGPGLRRVPAGVRLVSWEKGPTCSPVPRRPGHRNPVWGAVWVRRWLTFGDLKLEPGAAADNLDGVALTAGVDMGGTKIQTAIVRAGRPLGQASVPMSQRRKA